MTLLTGRSVDILASLVRIPSMNPGTYENAMAARVMELFEGTPVEARTIRSMPGRHSVGAVLGSRASTGPEWPYRYGSDRRRATLDGRPVLRHREGWIPLRAGSMRYESRSGGADCSGPGR